MRRWSQAVLVATLGWVLLAPVPALADTASEADLQYTLGQVLWKQRKYEDALPHLIASNRLVPNANVVFNIAQTYGLLHRDADAFNWYETYLGFTTLDEAGRNRGRLASEGLSARVAIVQLTSTPAGAEVFVDRTDLGSVGTAPRRLAVAPGAHTMIAQLDGFHEARVPVTAIVGATVAAPLQLTTIVGVLVVETEPVGATVRREDTKTVLGETPLRLSVPVGELRLIIERDGYVEQQRSAAIREDLEVRIKLELVMAASRVSVLSVRGEPEGARVRLEARDVGAVPLVTSGMAPGSFQLSVDAPGFEGYRAPVTLEPGAATRVEIHLVQPGGGKWRGVRWLGYGVGAGAMGGGLITGLVALLTRDAFFAAPSRSIYDAVNTRNVLADALFFSGLVALVATLVLDQLVWPVAHTRAEVSVVR